MEKECIDLEKMNQLVSSENSEELLNYIIPWGVIHRNKVNVDELNLNLLPKNLKIEPCQDIAGYYVRSI